MHTFLPRLALCAALLPSMAYAQAVASAPAATAAAADTAPQKPSELIAPAIDHLSQTVSQIQLEKWKGAVRDETDTNLRSIERDISTTLPPLVTAADAQPSSLVLTLPLLRNLDALCAVLIRVSVTARANAPSTQADALANALTTLQNARNTLSAQTDTLALAQQTQLTQLRAAVAAANAKPAAPPAPAPTPATVKATTHRVRKPAKPAAKPAAAGTASTAPASPAKPATPDTSKPAKP